jgi:hypothetical protein
LALPLASSPSLPLALRPALSARLQALLFTPMTS